MTLKKKKEISTNTTLSFSPYAIVKMEIENTTLIEESDEVYDSENDFDDDPLDPDFHPESDSSNDESEFETNEPVEKIEESAIFLVFWSCLLPLLQRCIKCNTKATVKSTFMKGTMLIVNHNTT